VAIKGTATGMARSVDRVQLASGLYLADITDAVGVTSWDFRVGAVSEFTFPAVETATANCPSVVCCARG
jgi:hypothetical protein